MALSHMADDDDTESDDSFVECPPRSNNCKTLKTHCKFIGEQWGMIQNYNLLNPVKV